jgi:hypothetical protein
MIRQTPEKYGAAQAPQWIVILTEGEHNVNPDNHQSNVVLTFDRFHQL